MYKYIYHFTALAEWQKALNTGSHSTPSLATEGFIHCSKLDQIVGSATKHAANIPDLVLLKIDTQSLDVPLVFENTSGGTEEFPHIYGTLKIESIIETYPLKKNDEGKYFLPF